MKTNTLVVDPDGRQAKVITLPISGRTPATAVIQYDDGRARVVDLAQCRAVENTQAGEEQAQGTMHE